MPLRPLILPAEVGQLARPCYADEALLTQIIAESEREDIRPRIGATLFVALKSTESDADLTGSLRILLLGGEWTDNSGRMHYLDGIKVALAYYTYGRVIRDGNITSTRYGAVIKSDDNSNSASDNAERQRQYRQAFDTADTMIVEAVNYITAMKVGGYEDCPGIRSNRAKMTVIGSHSAACGCESGHTTIISGKEGPSAYDVAVANGFRGSVEDWLASLVGPQGPEGPQGPQGPSVSLGDYYDKPEVDALLADKASASDVEAAISEEAAARENGDQSLGTQIAALENNIGESIGNIEDKVDDVSASLAVVQSDLEAEQAARVAADAALGARISDEEAARKSSDDSLSESIAAEATKRGSEDSRIEGLIGIERNERAAADAALELSKQDAISDLETIRSNAQNASNTIASIVNAGYVFAGVATSSTEPGTPDAKVFYIANGKGTYTNFGGLEVTEDDVVILYWDSSWHKVSTGIASQEKLSELESYAERKIEELAWIGASSGGKYDWVIGDKIFNTTKNKLAICTVPSPNQDFGPDYDASENSLYIYKGLLYRYNGTTLIKVDGKRDGDVDYVKDTIDGSFTKTYNVTLGTEVDGTSLSSPYVFPVKIGKGCKFTVLKTSSVISSIPTYAIDKDNKITNLHASNVGTEVNLVAPSDMVAIGVYITADKISANGTYTMKVTKDALWETQKKVDELGALSDDVKELQYKTDCLPSNSMFESSDFVNGDLYHGSIHSQDTWRVCMAEKHTAVNNIYLSAKTGFRFVVEYFVSDVYSGESGWKTNYMIPSGSVYQIKIARTTEDTTEIADINLFVSKVTFPTDFYSEFSGKGSLGYYGKKIPSLSIFPNQFNCKEETLVAELAPESGQPENVNRYTSGMVVCKGKAFCFGDTMQGGSKCTIFDLSDFSQTIVTLPWSAHNNNAQPTPYYYDANDTYPLMLVSRGDYASAGAIGQKFYFVRVVESGGSYVFTIVKEVSYSGFLGEQYNVSWFANYEKGELWCYTYPIGSWNTRANNPITFYKFDLSLVSPASGDYSNVNITGSDIKGSIVLQDHWITQSALYHDGKIFIQTEADSSWDNLTINGEPYDASKGLHFLFIIDAQSGYIETLVPLHNDIEQEGLCIYNGALYMSEKYTNAHVGRECFRLVRYTFD